jgi:hypothetical protein
VIASTNERETILTEQPPGKDARVHGRRVSFDKVTPAKVIDGGRLAASTPSLANSRKSAWPQQH